MKMSLSTQTKTTDKNNADRDALYREAQKIVEDSTQADQIGEGKEAGDKLIRDAGYDQIIKMLAQAQTPGNVERLSREKKARIGRTMKCLLQSKFNQGQALEEAKVYNDPAIQKTIQNSLFASGGATLEPGFMEEVIEYLRAETVVRRLGAMSIELINDSMSIPYISTGASSGYVAEGAATNATTLEFGQLHFSARKILALVPISNDWLRAPGAGAIGGATMVGNDIAESVSVTEDSAFIRGLGAAGSPKGLRYQAISGNVNAQTKAGGTVTVAEAGYDLSRLQYYPKSNNVRIKNGAYIFSPRTWLALITGRDGNSNLIWAPEMAAGTLLGQKFAETTSVPDNLGGGSDSEIIFASMATCVIAEAMNLTVDLLANVTYVNSSGTVVSGASQDESAVRVIAKHDFGCRHRGKEVAVITGVDWTQLA
jgi:HK97 family phage major capsid protein